MKTDEVDTGNEFEKDIVSDEAMYAKRNISETDLHIDRNVSGESIVKEGRESRRHQQAFGNRKYQSFRNHSSASDQPWVNTD